MDEHDLSKLVYTSYTSENMPLVCPICGGEDEHIFFHVP